MTSNLFLGRDAFINFSVSVTGLALIIPVLFWLYFGAHEYSKQNKDNKKLSDSTAHILFWLILLPLGFLIAPGSSYVIQKLIGSQPMIDTMIAIPTAMATVYAFIHLTECLHIHGKKRGYSVLCLAILIFVSSSVFISYDHPLGFKLVSNSMKIDPEVQQICQLVGYDYVMLPEEIYGQIGEYDSGVHANSLCKVPHDRYYAKNVTAASLEAEACLFVIRKSYDDPSAIEPHYTKTAETKHYVIYQRSE